MDNDKSDENTAEQPLPLRKKGASVALTNPIHIEALREMQSGMVGATAARQQVIDVMRDIELKERCAQAKFWRTLDAAGITDCTQFKYTLDSNGIEVNEETFEVEVRETCTASIKCIGNAGADESGGIPKELEKLLAFAEGMGGNNKKKVN